MRAGVNAMAAAERPRHAREPRGGGPGRERDADAHGRSQSPAAADEEGVAEQHRAGPLRAGRCQQCEHRGVLARVGLQAPGLAAQRGRAREPPVRRSGALGGGSLRGARQRRRARGGAGRPPIERGGEQQDGVRPSPRGIVRFARRRRAGVGERRLEPAARAAQRQRTAALRRQPEVRHQRLDLGLDVCDRIGAVAHVAAFLLLLPAKCGQPCRGVANRRVEGVRGPLDRVLQRDRHAQRRRQRRPGLGMPAELRAQRRLDGPADRVADRRDDRRGQGPDFEAVGAEPAITAG